MKNNYSLDPWLAIVGMALLLLTFIAYFFDFNYSKMSELSHGRILDVAACGKKGRHSCPVVQYHTGSGEVKYFIFHPVFYKKYHINQKVEVLYFPSAEGKEIINEPPYKWKNTIYLILFNFSIIILWLLKNKKYLKSNVF